MCSSDSSGEPIVLHVEVMHKEHSSSNNSTTSGSGRGNTPEQASPGRKQNREDLKRGKMRRGRRIGWRLEDALEDVKLQNALTVRMFVALTGNLIPSAACSVLAGWVDGGSRTWVGDMKGGGCLRPRRSAPASLSAPTLPLLYTSLFIVPIAL